MPEELYGTILSSFGHLLSASPMLLRLLLNRPQSTYAFPKFQFFKALTDFSVSLIDDLSLSKDFRIDFCRAFSTSSMHTV